MFYTTHARRAAAWLSAAAAARRATLCGDCNRVPVPWAPCGPASCFLRGLLQPGAG